MTLTSCVDQISKSSRPLRRRIERQSNWHEQRYCGPYEGQKYFEPCEDAAEVVAERGKDGVGGITGAGFEIAASEVTLGFHVSDNRLNRGAAAVTPAS